MMFFHRLIQRIDSLPAGTRIVVYICATLCGVAFSIIFVALFGTAVLRAAVVLAAVAFAAMVLYGLGHLIVSIMNSALARSEARQRAAVEGQLLFQRARHEAMRAITEGRIKPLTESAGVFLRNSEALWYRCPAVVAGRKDEAHAGSFYVTSLRVLFVSPECPLEIPIGNVNAAHVGNSRLDLIGKTAAATQTFSLDDPQLAAAHIERTVKAYHRQVDVGFEDGVGRVIPQDVKTAVWQRDGGRCIECAATDYLEFDHIIPHSKGGASTVDNVQLLCRRCNLKKGAAL